MKNIAFAFLSLLVIFSLAGCEGGTSGSVSGSSQSCKTDMQGGTCQGSFKKLSGTLSEDMPMSRTSVDPQVNVSVSVEKGAVKVYLIDSDGEHLSAIAKPNAPASVSGMAVGYTDSFRVYFEAMDGEAEGIKYDLTFGYP